MALSDLFRRLGPGFVTGTSDDDPSGIGTYVQAGAQFGYGQLWIALFSFPLMAAVQEMCGRIGLVTGQGLAGVIRKHYARPVLLFIIGIQVVTNTVNIGADLSAMAESAQLLWHIPYFVMLSMMTLLIAALIVLVPYKRYAAILKVLGIALLTYVVSAFTVHVDWKHVLSATFVPHIEWSKAFILMLIAVFGVTISPYEFFWQASEEVEELVEERKIAAEGAKRPKITTPQVHALRSDTIFGMFFSNVITFFIIITAAASLNAHGQTNVQSATQAAQALRPLAGPFTFVLFTIGIVSSGLLAIPVMAGSSAYAVAGAADWPRSLGNPFWERKFRRNSLAFSSAPSKNFGPYSGAIKSRSYFEERFRAGTLPAERRASLRPIAIACLRLVTFLPERPERNFPAFISSILRLTFFPAWGPYLRAGFFRPVFFRAVFRVLVCLRAGFFRPISFLRVVFLRVVFRAVVFLRVGALRLVVRAFFRVAIVVFSLGPSEIKHPSASSRLESKRPRCAWRPLRRLTLARSESEQRCDHLRSISGVGLC